MGRRKLGSRGWRETNGGRERRKRQLCLHDRQCLKRNRIWSRSKVEETLGETNSSCCVAALTTITKDRHCVASLLSFNWRRPRHQVVALWLLPLYPGNFIPRKSLPFLSFFFPSLFFSLIHGPLGKFQRNAGGPDSLYCIWSWLDAHMQDQQDHCHYQAPIQLKWSSVRTEFQNLTIFQFECMVAEGREGGGSESAGDHDILQSGTVALTRRWQADIQSWTLTFSSSSSFSCCCSSLS